MQSICHHPRSGRIPEIIDYGRTEKNAIQKRTMTSQKLITQYAVVKIMRNYDVTRHFYDAITRTALMRTRNRATHIRFLPQRPRNHGFSSYYEAIDGDGHDVTEKNNIIHTNDRRQR